MAQTDQSGSEAIQSAEALLWRRRILIGSTSLVVAWVRNLLQYGSTGWESIAEFADHWFIAFVGLSLAAAFYYGLRGTMRPKLLGKTDNDMDEAIVEFFSVVLLSTLIVFILAKIVPAIPSSEPL